MYNGNKVHRGLYVIELCRPGPERLPRRPCREGVVPSQALPSEARVGHDRPPAARVRPWVGHRDQRDG